jgi:hypothetical protein
MDDTILGFDRILITRAARLGWDVAILRLIAVLLGLSLTLYALGLLSESTPALPISPSLGMAALVVAVTAFRQFLVPVNRCGFSSGRRGRERITVVETMHLNG